MKQDSSNKNQIDIEQFVSLHGALVKGDSETKALCIATLVSPSDTNLLPFNGLCKVSTFCNIILVQISIKVNVVSNVGLS